MTVPKILVFSGSIRSASVNAKLAALAARELAGLGAEVSHVTLADYPMPIYNGDDEAENGVPENARRLKALFRAHHGIFIANPEYNGSVTPLTKNTIDWISRVRDDTPPIAAFRDRAFAIGGAAGGFGGLRSAMALRQILEIALGATVIPEQVLVRNGSQAFDEDGEFVEATNADRLEATCKRLVVEARRYAEEEAG